MAIAYHYCDLHAFLSIIENKKLWLSSVENMNDPTDSKWGSELLKERAKSKSIPTEIRDIIDDPEISRIAESYICCFSTNGDLLSQWARYADDGEGVAIGFNLNAFSPEHNRSNEGLTHETPGYIEVEYTDKNDRKNKLNQKIDSIINDFNNFKEEYENFTLRRNSEYSENEEYCAKHSKLYFDFQGINNYYLNYKNPAFKEESEIRIIYDHLPEESDQNMFGGPPINIGKIKHRVSGKTITSYFELDFRKNIEGYEVCHPIAEIVIGPKCEMTDQRIRILLENSGFDPSTITIKHSEATYR